MPVNRLDYTENRDGGNHGKFDVFILKYICVIKPYMGSVLLLQINYCRDIIINNYCIERSGV